MRVWVLGIVTFGAGQAAEAGPWLRDPGDGYGRVSVARESVEGLDANRFDAYGEFGLTQRWTLTAKAEQVQFVDASDFNAEGYRVTARGSLWSRETVHVAVEVGAVYGAAIGGVRGCDTVGGEARLSGGASGQWYGADWYAFADVASRIHGEGCWRDRLEIGAGQEVFRNLFFTNQIWLERGSAEAESSKFETGLLYRMDALDFSIAYREEFSGRFDEDGIVVAISRRF